MNVGSSQEVPDLASVLRTLATFSQPNVGPASLQVPSHPEEQAWNAHINPGLLRDTALHHLQNPGHGATKDYYGAIAGVNHGNLIPRSLTPQLTAQHQSAPRAQNVQTQPSIDATTIIDWSAGLRAASKLAARNEHLQHSVKKMIAEQHLHERQWWESRKALIEKQKARVEGKEQLRNVLRAVGGIISEENTISDEEELQLFDNKVYRASTEMVTAMTAELKAFGVPFFCTRPDLILPSQQEDSAMEINAPEGDVQGRKGQLTQAELLKLQRRLLEYLEDMYKD